MWVHFWVRGTGASPYPGPGMRRCHQLQLLWGLALGAATATGSLLAIDGLGKLKSVNELSQFVSRKAKADKVAVFSALGSKGCGKSMVLNKLFDTDFEVDKSAARTRSGLSISAGEAGAVLCLDCEGGEAGTEEETTSSKLTSLVARVSDGIVFNIWGSDIGRKVSHNTRTLQTLFQEQLQGEGSARTLLVVAVHDYESQGEEGDALTRERVLGDLQAVWDTVPKGDDKGDSELFELFDVEVSFLPHPRYRAGEYASALASLKERLAAVDFQSGRYSKSLSREGLAEEIDTMWTEIKRRDFTALPSRVELLATYQIEGAYTKALSLLEAKLASWKNAADRGRVLAGFGEAVADLSEDVLGVFDRDTQAFAVSPLRPKRHAELKSVLDKGVTALVRKQLANLRGQGMRRFKAGLVKAVGRENREDEEILVQKAQEQWFEAQAKGVVVPGVSGSYEKDKDDFVNDMVEFAQKWPSSPAYNVQAMKKLEAQASRKGRRRGSKIEWKPSFQLCSYLRMPGMGNFMGYGQYQLGPVNFYFGAANDRSLPDSRIEGELPPVLTLQPKVTFDVNL